ncbi:type II secretion system protein GspD [Terriglobus sp. RCC_193]|uniref:type II secretion system protein GspD n=1 Tax=Terriglobus sp. RCC_193 TaxID=3239218 RepID=UPI003525C5C8
MVAQQAPNLPPDSQEPAARKPKEPTQKDRDAAEKTYLAGAKELQNGRFPQAEKLFAQAIERNPQRSEYVQALLLAREHHVTDLLHEAAKERSTNPAAADALVAQARSLDAANPAVVQHASPVDLHPIRTERLATSIVLLHNASRHSYHQRGNISVLAEAVARDYGLHVVFDPDMPTKDYRMDVDDANFTEAMQVLGLVSDTMYVPLDEHTMLLAEETPQNRLRYERMVEEAYFFPGYAADQLKDFVSIAQTILRMEKVSVDAAQNAIVVRGPADLTDAAERIFSDLMAGQSDVVFDVKVYAVDHARTRNLGVVLPSSFTAYNLATEAQNIISANSSLVEQLIANGIIPSGTSNVAIAAYLVFVAGVSGSTALTNTFFVFGGGSTTTGVTTANAPSINLALSTSDARTLEDVQLRAGNMQNAVFKAGTRYPIQTSLYSDIASSTSGATSVNGVSLSSLLSQYLGSSSLSNSSVIPQVQYEDLGITLTVNPKIQWTGDITTHLEVKISALAGSSLNGIPILASRLFSSDLTVHDGDTVMMVSQTTSTETAAVTGMPGLSEIPGFQSTTNKNGSKSTGELVLLVTPHIARRAHTSAKGPYIPLQSRPETD